MRRNAKVAIALGLIGGSIVLLLWSTSASSAAPALNVTDAKHHALATPGSVVTVRGNVVEGTIVESDGLLHSFVVEDGAERLLVEFGQVAPDNFGAKQVVLNGVLGVDDHGTAVLRATAIQVGCASKY